MEIILLSNATLVIDSFHVQKLALDALQEIRIKHRWEVLDNENDGIEYARNKSLKLTLKLLNNGDTQLLARSRYLLYKKFSSKSYLGDLIIQRIKHLR